MVTIREEFVKGDSDRKGFGKHRLSRISAEGKIQKFQ